MKSIHKEAIIQTIPVLSGYVFIGIAFGIYLQSTGLGFHIVLLMSLFIYAGSMQFAAVPLLLAPFAPLETLLLTLSINARHLFYGITMLKPFANIKRKKPYMIFALTDESYSLMVGHKDNPELMFWMQLFNQAYWVVGSMVGFLFGQLIPFSTEGIEFSMAALFVVLFLDRLKEKRYLPMAIGLIASFVAIALFGAAYFVIPAMVIILVLFGISGDKL